MKNVRNLTLSCAALLISALFVACSDDKPVDSTTGVLNISAMAANANGSPSIRGGGGDNPALAGALVSAVQITSAKIVISRIRVKSALEDTLDFSSDVPRVIDLNLNGSAQSLGSVALAPGDYDRTVYKIDQLDSLDGTIYTNNPEMQDVSVRVAGYVNGSVDSAFLWTTALDEDQVYEHLVPFTITAGQTTSLVFTFDASQWFVDQQLQFIDPRDPQNQSLIENNVKNAFDIEEAQQGTF